MIRYAGIELLLDNPAGEVQAWLDQFLPLDDLRLVCDWTAAQINRSAGLPLPNYSRPLRPQLNTWYRPTGASRWSFGLFLATTAMKDAIVSAIGTGNPAQTLEIECNGLGRSWLAHLLPPRAISDLVNDPTSLWILPLVDERYYWQFIGSGGVTIGDTTPWSELLGGFQAEIGTPSLLGIKMEIDTIPAAYGYPNAARINAARFANAAIMVDALVHSVGQRIFLKYHTDSSPDAYTPRWYQSGNSSTWDQRRSANAALPFLGVLQAGTLSGAQLNLQALLPRSVQVVFRKWANGIVWDNEHYTKSISASTLAALPGSTDNFVKTIQTTALADYTSGGSTPDNQSACDALALQIATDFYTSRLWVQDSVYLGVHQYIETGYDDYVEFMLGRPLEDGTYTAQTRVHTIPYNFGVEEMLHQLSGTHEYGDHVLGYLTEDLAALGTAEIAVYEGSPPADTGRTLVVKNFYSATMSSGDPITATKIGKLWVADVGWGDGGGGNSLLGTADDFYTTVDGTGSFTTMAGAITAAIPKGLVLDGKEYHLIFVDDDHYEVSNPELSLVGRATALAVAANSVNFTIYTGTAGSESSTGETVSAYIRKGLVFQDRYYKIDWIESGWKCADPATEFVGTAAADIALDASVSQLIHTGSLGGESSSGTSVTVRNSYGAITNGQRVRCAWSDWPSGGGWEYVNARCP